MWLRSVHSGNWRERGKDFRSRWLGPRVPSLLELTAEGERVLRWARLRASAELSEAAREVWINLIAQGEVFACRAETLLESNPAVGRRCRNYLAGCLDQMARRIERLEEESGHAGGRRGESRRASDPPRGADHGEELPKG
jgi:hypothetical protein